MGSGRGQVGVRLGSDRGLTPDWVATDGDRGVRLDKFLAAADRLGSRGRAATALAKGRVFVNRTEANDGARRLEPGDEIALWMDRPGSAKRRPIRAAADGDLPILFEDDVLIVVNKPAGILTVPLERKEAAPSVQDALVAHLRSRGKRLPLVVHRIDRDTSGLVLFATRSDVQHALRNQFRRHEPERIYLAVVYGHPSPPAGVWRDRLVWDRRALVQKETHPRDPHGKDAESRYRVIETFSDAALVEVALVTGKRNQIRLQARLRGHTLVGEQRYVYGPDALRQISFPRQALHAYRLSFVHPVSGERLRFEAPVPQDFTELLGRLRRASARAARP